MSITNQQVIDRAAFELGYIESGESVGATDSADALNDFNSMMALWRVSGRDLNWFSQDDLTAVCPIPDWSEQGVISNLGVSLAAVFTVPVKTELAVKSRTGLNAITRALINLNLQPADMTNLPQGRNSGRSILTDS
jgi:hypothetical protein